MRRIASRAPITTVNSAPTVRALIVGDSKKDAGKLSAKTTDNVTIVAPKPPDYGAAPDGGEHPYAQTPWLDVAIESAHVWGCSGTIVGRAARFGEAAARVSPPAIDLTLPDVVASAR